MPQKFIFATQRIIFAWFFIAQMNTNDGYTLSKTKLFLISLVCFVLGFLCCEYIFHKEDYIYRNTLTEFDLGENEYSDGIIAFKCPKDFTCQASGDQSFPTMHVITSDTADYSKFTEATIEGDFQFTMNNEKCLLAWYMYHEKDTQKTGFQDMKETITEKGNKKIFEKESYFPYKTGTSTTEQSDTLFSRFMIIQDAKTEKVCFIDWISTDNKDKNIQALEELAESVRFE